MNSSPRVWKAWIPAVCWLVLIGIESTNGLSAKNTEGFLYPLLHFLTGIGPERFEVWHPILRKLGHFAGYFVLGVLLFRAWRATLPSGRNLLWSIHWASIAWGMSALVAGLDEWHQSFLLDRTGTVRDVVLDAAAALIAQALIFFYLRAGASPDRTYSP